MSEPANPPRFQSVIATILACLIAVAAMFFLDFVANGTILGFRAQESAYEVTTSALHQVATLLDCQFSGLIFNINNQQLSISESAVFGPLDRLLLLAAISIAATIAASRTWGLGPVRTIILIAISTLLTPFLLLILPGAFIGAALGFSDNASAAVNSVWLARDAGLILSCAIIALTWWLAAWIGADDKSPPASPPVRSAAFTTSLGVAFTTTFLLALFRLLGTLGLTINLLAHNPAVDAGHALAVGWSTGAALLLASAIMLFVSIFRTNLVRWAWLPILAAIPFGAGAASVVPLLAAIVASRDQRFRALRGFPLESTAPAKIARRAQRPLAPWIWALIALIVCAAYARFTRSELSFSLRLTALAQPLIFLSLLVLTPVCAFWDWNRTRRQTHRRLNSSACAALLIAASAAFYGAGYHREAEFQRQVTAAEPYFLHIQTIIAQFPRVIGPWVGTDVEFPTPAFTFAPPNASLSRRYQDSSRTLDVDILIDHGRDVRELMEYAPTNYHPSSGYTLESSSSEDWTVGAKVITGTNYAFTPPGTSAATPASIHVASFMVMPDGQILRNLAQLKAGQISKGGAQFQIIIAGNFPPETRRQIIIEWITATMPLIQAIANQP